jgi:hypothetical protein
LLEEDLGSEDGGEGSRHGVVAIECVVATTEKWGVAQVQAAVRAHPMPGSAH